MARITSTGSTPGPFRGAFITKAISISTIGAKKRDIGMGVASGTKKSSVMALKSGSVVPENSCIGFEVRPTL